MVSGGNDNVSNFRTISLYIFFSQCFGAMLDENSEDLHYVFEEKSTLEPV